MPKKGYLPPPLHGVDLGRRRLQIYQNSMRDTGAKVQLIHALLFTHMVYEHKAQRLVQTKIPQVRIDGLQPTTTIGV